MNKHLFVQYIKRVLLGGSEKYHFAGKTLKFKLGSRPVRRKYLDSINDVVRNDVLQAMLFEQEFGENDVLWDIGAHGAHYCLFAFAKCNHPQHIFAFEPDATARELLQENLRLNQAEKNVTVFDVAVSDRDGEMSFDDQGGNSNSRIVPEGQTTKTVTVKTRSLNSLSQELPQPTWVKIDIEGAEIHALRGASKLLANPNIRFVCELHPFAWEHFGVQYAEFTAIMKEYGRTVVPLDNRKKNGDLPFYGTVLF